MNELANQKLVLQKINGWKIYHLSAGMEDVVEMENDLSDRLEDFAQRLEDAASKYSVADFAMSNCTLFNQIKMLRRN